MPWYRSKAMIGVLRQIPRAALALAGLLAVTSLCAQQPVPITLSVVDKSGSVIAGASVQEANGPLLGHTDTNGQLTIRCRIPCRLRIEAKGFAGKFVEVSANVTVQLDPAGSNEQVTVTAYRTPLGTLESPVTTRQLSETTLRSTASLTLEGKIRQLPGVELFRRSSSLVANPSSQGVSLRGLGSTAASRTLLTEDDVPLNDPFAGWIRWQEQPELSIQNIEMVRGGASDLYGSSAIGGVINVIPRRPTSTLAEFNTSYGSQSTYDENALVQGKHGPWGALLAGGALGTDGFIQQAPFQRGPVDIASNVHSQNGLLLVDHVRGPLRLFVRGSGFNDARSNGTPFQTNGTRLWRYATGGDWNGPHDGTLTTRFYGSAQHFRQVFSSITNTPTTSNPTCNYRCGENPTRFSLSPENELGAVAHWSQPLGDGMVIVAGADVHDVRVWDREQTYGATAALTNLHDHQRDSAVYGEAMGVRAGWTLTASGRIDWFQNYDGHSLLWNGSTWVPSSNQPVQTDQHFFDPRLGVSRSIGAHFSISASGFRAFREPTPNELYRSTQVGNKLTLPTNSLLSERATGWETGIASEWHWGTIRTSYFDTQVNRPIVAVTTNPNSSPILLKRQNLGQIESRGVGIDFELAPQRWLAVDGGYQYAHAVVSRGTQDLGNWIPEVPRNMATLNLHAFRPQVGTLALQSRITGHQYDDDANLFLLHSFFRLDAYGSHEFGPHVEFFAAGENLFDRSIEVSKTPTTTLATPRSARAGVRLRMGGAR